MRGFGVYEGLKLVDLDDDDVLATVTRGLGHGLYLVTEEPSRRTYEFTEDEINDFYRPAPKPLQDPAIAAEPAKEEPMVLHQMVHKVLHPMLHMAMHRNPRGQVRVYDEDGRLLLGTTCAGYLSEYESAIGEAAGS